jgi:hypothetical protein
LAVANDRDNSTWMRDSAMERATLSPRPHGACLPIVLNGSSERADDHCFH